MFFSSLLSSRPLPLEKTSSLHLSRSDGAKTRFLGTCAPLLCLAPAEERERGARGRSCGITMAKTHTATAEDQHVKDDRCRASFLRKDRGEQRRELLRSNYREHAISLLLVVFVRTCTEEARPFYSNLPGRTGTSAEAAARGGTRGVYGGSAEKNTGSVRSIKGG